MRPVLTPQLNLFHIYGDILNVPDF
jgi:hypothetical protein